MASPNDTYTGPVIENENRSSSTPGGVFLAVGLAVLAIVIAFVGIWIGNSADGKAVAVNVRVTKLQTESNESWAKQLKWNEKAAAELAAQSTRTDDLEFAVNKLQTKAEQKLVDQLVLEMKDKASNTRVEELASNLLNKADKKAVDRIVRRMGGMTKRVDNIVNLNKLIEVAPVAPAAPPPPPAPAAKVVAPVAQPHAVVSVPATGPSGRPETPARLN